MIIKNLENAETLPYRLSIRKSSGYDSWESYHVNGRCYYQWLIRFLEKHVGESFNAVYSKFKKRIKDEKVPRADAENLLEILSAVSQESAIHYPYYLRTFYVDENGTLCKSEKKTKCRDKVINYGEPTVRYLLKDEYLWVKYILIEVFGYDKAELMVENGITSEMYANDYAGGGYRFNAFCERMGIKSFDRWTNSNWREIWKRVYEYPYTETLKYRSDEYYKYRYETIDAQRKYEREMKVEKINKFNRCEIEHGEHPFLIY